MLLHMEIDKELCIGCGDCLYICPVGAICLKEGKAIVDEKCVCCGACVGECLQQAIKIVK